MFCSGNRWSYEIISDLGSGMNYNKKGLKKLLNLILEKRIDRLILTHKDRLLRFGAELIFSLCEAQNIEVVIINRGDQPSFEEELASDVLEIITMRKTQQEDVLLAIIFCQRVYLLQFEIGPVSNVILIT